MTIFIFHSKLYRLYTHIYHTFFDENAVFFLCRASKSKNTCVLASLFYYAIRELFKHFAWLQTYPIFFVDYFKIVRRIWGCFEN